MTFSKLRSLLSKALTSIATMFFLMAVLGIGAAIATFIENDHGTHVARELVYDSLWYETILTLTIINMVAVILKVKMYKRWLTLLIHLSFAIILIGAGLTRYFGFEGNISLREGAAEKIVNVNGDTITLPFSIFLNQFKLERYPGSHSPSTYTSAITIEDSEKNKIFSSIIGMNTPYDYRGYRLFQNTYDADEKGATLTVNKDPGKVPTYIGYYTLFLSLILNLFHKKSRFRKLLHKVNKLALFLLLFIPLFLNKGYTKEVAFSSYIQTYLDNHREKSVELSNAFGSLVVQSRMGRLKPLDTLNREILRKLSGKRSLYDLSPNQIILGIYTRPELWKKIPLIKVKSEVVKQKLNLAPETKLISFNQLFNKQGQYILETSVHHASKLAPFHRSKFDKEVLKIDERISIFFMVEKGTLLKIFPIPNDINNKWLGFQSIWNHLNETDNNHLQTSTKQFIDSNFSRNYSNALGPLQEISKFQKIHGKKVYPSLNKIKVEVFYNQLNLFPRLIPLYIIFGLGLFISSFFFLFKPNTLNIWFLKSIQFLSVIIISINLFALALRTYISGHAPMSDTYESLLYIAFSSAFAGLLYMKKSLFIISSSMLMSGIFMFTAHLGNIDPEITNLVPVLKSFWLSVHVSVITASYGFFGISCLLGVTTLLLYIFRNKKRSLENEILKLTWINEVYLILGLTLLIIGNFLGAIWANESWGRYWGWDPKETWAYISIITYTLLIHLRLIKKIYSHFLFAVGSLLSFSTILMTYFGVNFYLSGKHSYATGDPILLPSWVIYLCMITFFLIAFAFYRFKHYEALKGSKLRLHEKITLKYQTHSN